MLTQIALAAGIPAVFIAHAVWLGCHKAGCSPLAREWWTS